MPNMSFTYNYKAAQALDYPRAFQANSTYANEAVTPIFGSTAANGLQAGAEAWHTQLMTLFVYAWGPRISGTS
jgi:phage gp46-like protein